MLKTTSLISALLLGLSLGGATVAADNTTGTQSGTQSGTQQPSAQPGTSDPSQSTGARDSGSTDNEAYLAALKKCESMSAGEKTKCVDAAKKKFGQM